MVTSCLSDGSVGWNSGGCGIDFTIAFEDYILVLIPAACLLLLAPLRLRTIWSTTVKVNTPTFLQLAKTLSGTVFVGFSFGFLITTCTRSISARSAEISVAVLAFLASITAFALSVCEHVRSNRPSKLLQLYLLVTLIVQSVRLRTIWIRQDDIVLEASGLGQVISCAIFLAAESIGKESILLIKQRRSPQDVNGIFSEGLFLWLNNLFVRGYRNILEPGELDPVDEDLLSPETERHFRLAWLKHYHHNPKVSMVRIVASALKYDLLMSVVPRLLLTTVNFAQPYLILKIVDYLEHTSEGGTKEGILLVVATVLVYSCISVFQSWYWQSVSRFEVKLRACLTSSLHDKALGSRPDGKSSPLTLMNVDVERILDGLKRMHEFWATTISVGIALALLYMQIGVVFLAPLLLLVIMIALSAHNGTIVAPKQKMWFSATQDRISYITGTISAMKNVKLLGIGPSVLQRGTYLRVREVDAQIAIRKAILLNLVISLAMFPLSALVMYGGLAIDTHYGGLPLNNARLFTSLSILKLVTTPMLDVVQSIPMLLQAISSLERIQDYLVIGNHEDKRLLGHVMNDFETHTKGAIQFTDDQCIARMNFVSSGYADHVDTLKNVTSGFHAGKLSLVVGPVGSGKSTILKSLLGETTISKGTVSTITEDTAFCDQVPWLFNASVKDNICGSAEYDQAWFARVTWACGLHDDFAQLPQNIGTLVGSDGTSLSGGQKNRISLARALYSRKRLFILDDVLSGLDTQTERLVFMRVFGPSGLLKQMHGSVILATHAIGWTRYADAVIVLDSGKIVYQGSPASAPAPYRSTEDPMHRPVSPSEDVSKTEQDISSISHRNTGKSATSPLQLTRPSDMRVYKQYFSSFGVPCTITYFVLSSLYAGGLTVQSLWLKWWATAGPTNDARLGYYAGVLTGITFGFILVLLAFLMFAMLVLLPRSSKYLHAKQWAALVKVFYPAWGAKDTGSVANRFSQDISIIDGRLNMDFINFTTIGFQIMGSAAILLVATPFIAATFPPIVAIFWIIQKVYLRTSKQLRIMDLEAKAPLCTHFLETVSGVVTIKAFGWSEAYRQRNEELLVKSQIPFYLMASVQNWLQLVLNLVVAGLATVVMAIAVKLRGNVDAGYFGLALVEIMDLGIFCELLVVSWTGLEVSLGAVARLNEFMETTPPEEPGRITPPSDWLSQGVVNIEDLTASYSSTAVPILNNVSLQIQAGEKVAICGRTGSGKSSLASALFGLLQIREGNIKIDGIDITDISQDLLRSKMVAIPQDPYFAPGTVRANLALVTSFAHNISDSAMVAALGKVGLLEKFERLAAGSGETWLSALDVELTPTEMLTKGQMQLFAMARAILSPGQIVMIDEATSGLDHASEELVQMLLRREFAGRTIVAIAHHLKTVMDFDTVVVMDNGRIAEVGNPEQLKDKRGSLFSQLLQAVE